MHGNTSSIASVRWSCRSCRSTRVGTAQVTRGLGGTLTSGIGSPFIVSQVDDLGLLANAFNSPNRFLALVIPLTPAQASGLSSNLSPALGGLAPSTAGGATPLIINGPSRTTSGLNLAGLNVIAANSLSGINPNRQSVSLVIPVPGSNRGGSCSVRWSSTALESAAADARATALSGPVVCDCAIPGATRISSARPICAPTLACTEPVGV